jgi:type IV pilus assembly protein PilE
MKMNYKKGFTLIELLVVIAIIGILSSVVLASLNTAREKGANAAAKGNLSGIRAQAELVYDNTGSYATVCSDSNIVAALASAKSATGYTAVCAANIDSPAGAAWAAEIQLKGSGAGFYCVDSRGTATTSSATLGVAVTSTTTAACI